MKVVTEANWIFWDHGDLDEIFQKFTQAIRVVVQYGGFIPPSTSTPRSMAVYVMQRLNSNRFRRFCNNLSFEENLEGISSVYTGTNGTLSFKHWHRELKSEFAIVYAHNEKSGIAISLEHLGAMVSILGMPNSFEVELTGDDRSEILLPEYIESGAAKLGGYS
ncbi:MAG: hypothetical protein PHU86_03500 [Patescibacteria group bacterium]|nr:hypothetical protein [Patescibacteria group bacterium]